MKNASAIYAQMVRCCSDGAKAQPVKLPGFMIEVKWFRPELSVADMIGHTKVTENSRSAEISGSIDETRDMIKLM